MTRSFQDQKVTEGGHLLPDKLAPEGCGATRNDERSLHFECASLTKEADHD